MGKKIEQKLNESGNDAGKNEELEGGPMEWERKE